MTATVKIFQQPDTSLEIEVTNANGVLRSPISLTDGGVTVAGTARWLNADGTTGEFTFDGWSAYMVEGLKQAIAERATGVPAAPFVPDEKDFGATKRGNAFIREALDQLVPKAKLMKQQPDAKVKDDAVLALGIAGVIRDKAEDRRIASIAANSDVIEAIQIRAGFELAGTTDLVVSDAWSISDAAFVVRGHGVRLEV